MFSDASSIDENGKIGIFTGLIVGERKEGTLFHTVCWISHKTQRPVKSVPAAEILAASEATDEEKRLKKAYSELLNAEVKLIR